MEVDPNKARAIVIGSSINFEIVKQSSRQNLINKKVYISNRK